MVIIVGSCGCDDDVVWSGLAGLDLPAFVMEPVGRADFVVGYWVLRVWLVKQCANNTGGQWESAWSMTESVS